MSEKVRVAKAAGVVGLATLASRVMGYIRDMVMSWAFGTGLAADAFYVAYRIPNLLRELLAEGSMSAAFIPVFTETLTKESKESARHLANAVFARFLVDPRRPDRARHHLRAHRSQGDRLRGGSATPSTTNISWV